MELPFGHKKETLVLGRTGKYRFFPRFAVPSRIRQYHTYVVGLTGSGKSRFLHNCLLQDIRRGRGCGVIDPHGDLARDVLRTLLDSGKEEDLKGMERVVYVAPRQRKYILPFNVLAKTEPSMDTYEVSQRVISAFMRTWARTLLEPPRFQQIMRASLAALIENRKTLCDLYDFLTQDDYRTQLLETIPDAKVKADCKRFFENEYNHWGRDRSAMISSTTNKITALTDNPNLFYMLGQKENRLDIRKIMDEGKVLIVDLGDCDDETKRLIGTLIVTGFEQAALSRSGIPLSDRRPFYLYIDEFQDFACHPGAAETFSHMLSQVRKFGLHLILANQSIAQLSQELQTALSNAQTLVTFRVSRADAEVLAKQMGTIDLMAIKRESQNEIQHPIYLPMYEQRESFIQHLTSQRVRQATVKTADGRLAVVWSEMTSKSVCSQTRFEQVLDSLLKRNGVPFIEVHATLVPTFPTGEEKGQPFSF